MRKGIEAWLTVLIELMWDSQRILEMYLNIAQFSGRTFGVESPSWEVLDRQGWILTQMSQLGGTAYLQSLQEGS